VTIAAEFTANSVPTAQGPLSTEDFVVVEMALFGAPDARLKISANDFFAPQSTGKRRLRPACPME